MHLNFKLEHVFPAPLCTMHMPNNLQSVMYHEKNLQSPIRTYAIIALHEH